MDKGDLIIHAIDVMLFIALGENRIRKSKRGEKLFNLLESGVVRIANWRANADVKKEIGIASKFFFTCFATAAVLMLLAFRLDFRILATSLALIGMLSLTGGLSLQWTFNHKEFIKPYVWILLLLLGCSALFVISDALEGTHELTNVFLFEPFGIQTKSYWIALAALWGIVLAAFTLFYILAWTFYGPISFGMVSVLYLTHKLSKIFVRKLNRDLVLILVFMAAVIVRIIKPFF